MREHQFFADAHFDRKKFRAAVVLEELIQELPNLEGYRAARFANQIMQQTCIYVKDLRNLKVKRNTLAKMAKLHLYNVIEKKPIQNVKVKSLLRNMVNAKFSELNIE